MPFSHIVVVTGINDFRVEVTYSVEIREELSVPENSNFDTQDRLKENKIRELEAKIIKKIWEELGRELKREVISSVGASAGQSTQTKVTTPSSK